MSTGVNPVPVGPESSSFRTVRVTVGRIGKAHGLRGEVSVQPRTDDPDRRFACGAEVIAGEPLFRTLTVDVAREHSGRLLVKFLGIDDRKEAEAVRGVVLEADVDALETPDDPDEYFDRQLVGLDAITPQGVTLGTVTQVMHLPGHDLLALATPEGLERLVPFVQEIVPIVDLAAGHLIVAAPLGLFDANSPSSAPTPPSG